MNNEDWNVSKSVLLTILLVSVGLLACFSIGYKMGVYDGRAEVYEKHIESLQKETAELKRKDAERSAKHCSKFPDSVLCDDYEPSK